MFEGTVVGIRFKTRRPRGGGGEHLYYDRIRMNLEATAIKWDMLGTPEYVGELAERLPARKVNNLTPFYRDISITNIIIENSTHFLKIYGIPESPMTNLMIDNVDATGTNFITIRDAVNVKINNASIKTTDTTMEIIGSQNIQFNNVLFDVNGGKLNKPKEVLFNHCKIQ